MLINLEPWEINLILSVLAEQKYRYLHDSVPQDIKAQIIMGIKNRMYGEGMILETLTFNEWIKQVEAL